MAGQPYRQPCRTHTWKARQNASSPMTLSAIPLNSSDLNLTPSISGAHPTPVHARTAASRDGGVPHAILTENPSPSSALLHPAPRLHLRVAERTSCPWSIGRGDTSRQSIISRHCAASESLRMDRGACESLQEIPYETSQASSIPELFGDPSEVHPISVTTSLASNRAPHSPSIARNKLKLDDFTLLKVIGKGSYGRVLLVRHNTDASIYAMKMLKKVNIVQRNQIEHTRAERNILESIHHPFIVRLFYAFQTLTNLYFVLEYCPGGELFFHLSRLGRFTEQRARFYSAEVVLALQHLHSLNIVYRDLKPENVLLDAEGHIRLTDFGLSKEGVVDSNSARSLCGTPEYLAPEILTQQGHGKSVDWWSLGALVYEMLTGLPPFYTRSREKLLENIKFGELKFPSLLSPLAVSLLQGLLERDPDRRLGSGPTDADEVRRHPFFASIDWRALLAKKIPAPFKPDLSGDTDVQYFDRDFVALPVMTADAVESSSTQLSAVPHHFDGFTYEGTPKPL